MKTKVSDQFGPKSPTPYARPASPTNSPNGKGSSLADVNFLAEPEQCDHEMIDTYLRAMILKICLDTISVKEEDTVFQVLDVKLGHKSFQLKDLLYCRSGRDMVKLFSYAACQLKNHTISNHIVKCYCEHKDLIACDASPLVSMEAAVMSYGDATTVRTLLNADYLRDNSVSIEYLVGCAEVAMTRGHRTAKKALTILVDHCQKLEKTDKNGNSILTLLVRTARFANNFQMIAGMINEEVFLSSVSPSHDDVCFAVAFSAGVIARNRKVLRLAIAQGRKSVVDLILKDEALATEVRGDLEFWTDVCTAESYHHDLFKSQ